MTVSREVLTVYCFSINILILKESKHLTRKNKLDKRILTLRWNFRCNSQETASVKCWLVIIDVYQNKTDHSISFRIWTVCGLDIELPRGITIRLITAQRFQQCHAARLRIDVKIFCLRHQTVGNIWTLSAGGFNLDKHIYSGLNGRDYKTHKVACFSQCQLCYKWIVCWPGDMSTLRTPPTDKGIPLI